MKVKTEHKYLCRLDFENSRVMFQQQQACIKNNVSARFGSTYSKIAMIQISTALHKDTQIVKRSTSQTYALQRLNFQAQPPAHTGWFTTIYL